MKTNAILFCILQLSITFVSIEATLQPCTSAMKMIAAVEHARRYPKKMAGRIHTYMMRDGTEKGRPDDATCGKEAYDFMNSYKSDSTPYKISNALSLSCAYSAQLAYENGSLAHTMLGKQFWQRIDRFMDNRGYAIEGIAGGPQNADGSSKKRTCAHWVEAFIIDYKVPSRGHRNGLMNVKGNLVSIGCYSNGYMGIFEMSERGTTKLEFQKDYPRLGIYNKYDGKELSTEGVPIKGKAAGISSSLLSFKKEWDWYDKY